MLRRLRWTALLLAGLAPAPAAEAPKGSLEAQPAAVAVPPQGGADVLVVFRNPSDATLGEVRLSWLAPEGVKVAADSAALPDLGPNEEVAGTLRVSRDPARPFPVEGTVSLRAAYNWLQKEGQKVTRVPRIAVASFKVALQQPDKIEQVASVEVKSAAKALFEHRPANVYLVVANISNEPLEVLKVDPVVPPFVSAGEAKGAFPKALGPRDTLVIPYELTAGGEEPIKPGKHLMLFEVALRWTTGGREISGIQVAPYEMDVGVLGESEILTALGVPTFLVLPGFLMVVAFGLLWNHAPSPSGQPRKEFSLLSGKGAEFWLVAVSLSMLAAAAYPRITDWLGERRSYLEGYDLADVIRVWTGSILIGVLTFLAKDAFDARREARRRERELSEGDEPLAVLRKLKLQKAALVLPRVDVRMDGQERRAFQLRRDGDRIWVAPRIRLVGLDRVEPAVRTEIESRINQGDPGALAELIEGTQRRVTAEWDPAPVYGFRGARSVPFADVLREYPANSLVQTG